MIRDTAVRLQVAAVLAAGSCVLAACGSAPRAPQPSPSRTGPDPALVSWATGYCSAVKRIQLSVYVMPKEYDINSDADLPKAAAGLQTLDAALTTAVTGLRKLPKAPPPAQRADTLAAGELTFYSGLLGKVTQYRTLLPRGGVQYAKAALTVTGVDLASHTSAVETDSVPGLRQAMKATTACELVG
ncbi:hypothetical protein [Fodinicola feengrottensis]|uniref:hypothetical protein n=1 Tax=Fodinicola feengrottensis TaxID=435914 RepID=UPI0031E41EE5